MFLLYKIKIQQLTEGRVWFRNWAAPSWDRGPAEPTVLPNWGGQQKLEHNMFKHHRSTIRCRMEGTFYFCESLDGHIWSPSKTWASYVVLQCRYNLFPSHLTHISEYLCTRFSLVMLLLNTNVSDMQKWLKKKIYTHMIPSNQQVDQAAP